MSLSRTRNDEPAPKIEINIVPLVDVALVLLVIFMVTATFVKSAGMSLELPEAASTQAAPSTVREIVIDIGADGAFVCQGRAVRDAQLPMRLRMAAPAHGRATRVIIRGDRRAAHGRVVQAMAAAQEAGLTHLIVATRLPAGDARDHP